MRNRLQWILGGVLTAGGLLACGGDDAPATAAPAPTLPPAAAAGTGAVAPTTPSATSAVPATPPEAQPIAQPPAAPPAAQPAAAASPPPPAAAPTTERPGDSCEERRVSYTKPCTQDPDPCGLKSGYLGDEYCLKPPAAGEGIQIHIGPSDYTNMAEVMKYVIKPGEEFNNSVIGPIDLTGEKFWNRITVHMRPGSHHWISTVVAGKPEAKFYNDTGCGAAQSIGSLGGGQNLIYDNPPGGKAAPENEGLGRSIQGDSSLCMNLHAYNFSEQDQLREMWINVYFVDEAKVTQRASGIGMVGGLGLNLAPHEDLVETYMGTFDKPGRIIQLFGHRHVWTPRFAVWLNENLVYDSWSWEESATFNYDSLTMNPPIATDKRVDGAVSGLLDFKAGDTLKFSCFIENKSDKTLRFSNELYEGEMCNLWGSAVGAGLSGNFF
ncbi:MAG: hypothetical protein ABW321_35795 [Polyangiales bacterium]